MLLLSDKGTLFVAIIDLKRELIAGRLHGFACNSDIKPNIFLKRMLMTLQNYTLVALVFLYLNKTVDHRTGECCSDYCKSKFTHVLWSLSGQ